MRIKLFLLPAFLFLARLAFAQSPDTTWVETPVTIETPTGKIYGTLLTPKDFFSYPTEVMDGIAPIPLVFIIAGSGPTDRDGNNPYLSGKNNSLKMLAEELCKHNIASLCYDKRGIGESKEAGLKERDLRFDNYVDDAFRWIDILKLGNYILFRPSVIFRYKKGTIFFLLYFFSSV